MKKLIKLCLWALAFVPLVVSTSDSVFFPFVSGKSLFLRSFLVLTSLLFLLYFLYQKKFREEIIQKINKLFKHPLVISVFVFISAFIISTIFAVNKFTAFWGNTSRAEGLAGMLFFFSFFVFSLLIFEKKDWLLFFKLSLLTSFIVLGREFWQFFSGISRPGSFADNPTFLAGYLLFSIFCALIVFESTIPLEIARARSDPLSLTGSILMLILSVFGIFIAETRGTMLGLALGIVAVLIYAFFKGREVNFWKLNLRKTSAVFLCLLVIFSALFISTRKSEVWQRVPGLSRASVVSAEDSSTASRLIVAKISLQAVNPAQNGWKKLFIGWGPENFILAYGKYFDPALYKYEADWFDRAHNELLDRLVMNGLFGLLAYLSIWFFFFKICLSTSNVGKTDVQTSDVKKKQTSDVKRHPDVGRLEFSILKAGFLFFGVSFLIHLLFIFDQITTLIPFYAVLAFAVYQDVRRQDPRRRTSVMPLFAGIFFSILALFLCFVFFTNDLPGYMQMQDYLSIRKTSDAEAMSEKIDTVFEPFTTTQMNIRNEFLSVVSQNYNSNNQSMVNLLDVAFYRADEYAKKIPLDLKFLSSLAYIYTIEGSNLKNPEYLSKGENYFRKTLMYAPNRPDVNYRFALNLFYQNKYDESFSYFEKVFSLDPSFYSKDGKVVEGIYTIFLQHFYQTKDKADFAKAVERLEENGYANKEMLDQFIK